MLIRLILLLGAALPSVPPINEDLSKNRNGVPKPFSDRPFAPRTGAVRVEILGQTRGECRFYFIYPQTLYFSSIFPSL